MLIYNIGQLLTVVDGLGLHEGAWLRIEAGKVDSYGPMSGLPRAIEDDDFDAGGQVVLPGFVDCHTHLVNAGGMHGTFADRCRLVEEIPPANLADRVEAQLRLMRQLGTTTVEIKTGYARTDAAIDKCLAAVPRRAGVVLTEMSPLADSSRAYWTLKHSPRFVDALCDPDGLSVEQLREPLHAVRSLGTRVKLHVCVTAPGDGVPLALEMDAISVEHLLHASQRDIDLLARSKTTAVLLPAMAYYSSAGRYAPARALMDAGVAVALATDCNPGDSPTHSMAFVIHLAVREMKMTAGEAIIAATRNAARAIGEEHRVGSLEPGKVADVIVLATDDYRDLPAAMGANLVEAVFTA